MRANLPAIAVFCAAAASAKAQAPSFVMHPFGIPGAISVSVTAVNDSGVAVGSYVSPTQPYGAGFVGHRGAVSTMALAGQPSTSFPQGYIPAPTSINNRGSVVGTYPTATFSNDGTDYLSIEVFAWRDGTYLDTLYGSTMPASQPQQFYKPFIGTNDNYSFNVDEVVGSSLAFTGRLSSSQNSLPILNASVASVNAKGTAAGATIYGSVFIIPAWSVPLSPYYAPPNAIHAFGGWTNDANQVAGSYEDKGGELHGFVYLNGNYTIFDMPVRPDTLTTQGIDQDGRVVGVYTKGVTQTAFVYANAVVTRLKPFPLTDTVHVAISHFGKFMAISDTNAEGVARSWVVVPAPSGD